MDLRRKQPLTTAHQAKEHEAVVCQPSVQVLWKSPQLSQLHEPVSEALRAHPNPSKLEQ